MFFKFMILSVLSLLVLSTSGCEQVRAVFKKAEENAKANVARDRIKAEENVKAELIAPGEESDGAKLYREKMQKGCSMSGYMLARKRTKAEWELIAKEGKLAETIKALCPTVEFKNIWTPDIYEYLHKNALASN
jgi:hypothetical protein